MTVVDGKYDPVEPSPASRDLARERGGDHCRVVAEDAAAPRAEQEYPVTVRRRDLQHPSGPGARAMLSSCAWAPVRKPPPGFFADANTRHAAAPPSRRAACRLVSLVTSITGSAPLPTGTSIGSSGANIRVPFTAAPTLPASVTSRPPGDRYRPVSTMVTVSRAMARNLALMGCHIPRMPGSPHLLFRLNAAAQVRGPRRRRALWRAAAAGTPWASAPRRHPDRERRPGAVPRLPPRMLSGLKSGGPEGSDLAPGPGVPLTCAPQHI